ncbi:AAA domain-containing protein [Ordospora pajunii]|uniref:AAA domain-containing protein n=1 Tax=Ordospora pajunii TaxID=3039483 RepID=UPI0029528F7B|nr:AAA domain-containing protein [Ordospora pajunii]KAH9411417.1 AAA domain-containing protein [Ordospora pajunii]
MKILMTGTPGVGKTTLCARVSEVFGMKHVDVSKYIEENKLYDEYSEEYKSLVFDEEMVRNALASDLCTTDSYIIDTHCCEVASGLDFDVIFVLTLPIEILYRRLKDRGYDESKIKENVECEIFGVAKEDAECLFDVEIHVVGSENGEMSVDDALEIIESKIKSLNSK